MCVCMCVFGISVLKIFVERWFWELKMLIGSSVELHAWLHSYLCFSLLEKQFWSNLDTSSLPPWHLAICRALKVFSYLNLNRSSTVGGLNEKVPGPSIASRQLVDRLSFSSCVFTSFLDTFSTAASVDVDFLDTFLDRWLDTSICQELLRIYIFFLPNPVLISSISLDLSALVHLPNTISLTPNLFPSVFFKLFQVCLHLVSF